MSEIAGATCGAVATLIAYLKGLDELVRRRIDADEAFGTVVTRLPSLAARVRGITNFAIAPGQLIIVVVVLAVASVGAAWLPARRAAKLDILNAISSE